MMSELIKRVDTFIDNTGGIFQLFGIFLAVLGFGALLGREFVWFNQNAGRVAFVGIGAVLVLGIVLPEIFKKITLRAKMRYLK